MTIQWFPGHMAKAKREVKEQLKLVDLVIELRDARAPSASKNEMLHEMIRKKQCLTVLMKKDLADESMTSKWLNFFNEKNKAKAIDVNNSKDINELIEMIENYNHQLGNKNSSANYRPLRAIILGIPNVGKSSLINRLANRKIAKIGNVPGITRQQNWIRVKNKFDLLDTPGILWPKFKDESVAYKLAAIGTIKDDLLPLQDVAAYALNELKENYPDQLYSRYDVIEDLYDMWDIFEAVGKRFGLLESGGKVNFDRVAERILHDLRTGAFGKITLERP